MQNHDPGAVFTAPPARRLLPAARPQTLHSRPLLDRGPLLPRPKAHSTAACETCRRRKVKCNAARPACGYCVSTASSCIYPTSSVHETHAQALKRKLSELKDQESTYREVFEHLRDRPEPEAGELLKRIRGGAEPESILRYIREGDLLLQLALAPETRYRYVFPFVQDMPEFLVSPENPYLSAQVYEWMTTGMPASQRRIESSQFRDSEPQSTYYKPYHAAELVDPLLDSVKPSEWTTVSSDDVLMRKILASYFLMEYHWFPAFQKDYFLQDMAAGRRSCCSSLLVNIVLALGSMVTSGLPNRYEYWNPKNLSYQFLAEANRLWEIETVATNNRVRLTTIQGAVLLHVMTVMNAMDAVGATYTRQAVDMARLIGLFGPDGARQNSRRTKARAFTAWALFDWQSMLSFNHFEPPLVQSPPASPLPDPSAEPEWYGQVWLRYPLDPRLYTTNFPYQFKAQSEFRAFLNEGWLQKCGADFGGGQDPAVALPAINSVYSRMKKWYDNLPGPLTPARIALPSQLMLHIDYHNTVISLYEPICGALDPHSNDETATAHRIRNASTRDLETLLRLYYLRHGYDHGDSYLGKCLVQLGFMTLKRIASLPPTTTTTTDPSAARQLTALRSTLILAAKGIHAQGANHFLNKPILRALMAKMGAAERQLLGQVIGVEAMSDSADSGVAAHMSQVRSKVLPSAISLGDDPEMHRLGRLVGGLKLGRDEEARKAVEDAGGGEGDGDGSEE